MFWVLQLFLLHSFAYCIHRKLAHNSLPSSFQGKPCEINWKNNCSLKSKHSVSPTGLNSTVFSVDFSMSVRWKEKVCLHCNECCNQVFHSRFAAMANANWNCFKCQFLQIFAISFIYLPSVVDVNTSSNSLWLFPSVYFMCINSSFIINFHIIPQHQV